MSDSPASAKLRTYTSDAIEVTWDARRCIHAAECVRGLPQVFDPEARPWVQPDKAAARAVAEAVCRCPTGALKFRRRDGGAAEEMPSENRARVEAGGPVYLRGDVVVVGSGGNEILRDTRVALCRCGASENKPFCDGKHAEIGFDDPGALAGRLAGETGGSGPVRVLAAANGPLVIDGPLTVEGADAASCQGSKGALCRCGHSATKPFCDGSHKDAGFIG